MGSTVGNAAAPNGAVILATNDGGGTWLPQVIPPITGYLSAVSCSDQRSCVAVGQASLASNGQGVVLTTADGGRSWQSRPIPPTFLDVTAVSCRPDHRCLAVGDVPGGAAALTSAAGGATWVQRGLLPTGVSGATGVSCPADAQCWVTAARSPDPDHVAGVVGVTTDGGTNWTGLGTPGHVGYLNGIACPSPGSGSAATPTTSAAAGTGSTAGSATGPGGSSAPAHPVVAGLAGATCVVVGTTSDTLGATRTGRGVLLTTTNGGQDWSPRPVPTTTAALAGVSCTAADSCVMVGTTVATAARAGTIILTGPSDRPWSRATEVDAPQPLTAVSCASQSRCVAVGESISEHLVGG